MLEVRRQTPHGRRLLRGSPGGLMIIATLTLNIARDLGRRDVRRPALRRRHALAMARQLLWLRLPSCHWPAGQPRVAAQAGGAAAGEAAAASSRHQAMPQRSAGRPLPTAPHSENKEFREACKARNPIKDETLRRRCLARARRSSRKQGMR
jgi:hypothetical protein